ncbi:MULTISPECIES: V-type ATP synthase subunit I [Caproicibacterium]|uniref:V-type ATPase 116kDa subunit family protein n=1 Tax=Caproicibacterium argilliputei TaxID=3030016 RepID=A0AA97DBM0_9FIRM|nr:V-type ATPase 116kDa subunit family protein [Caproicibacterium argilliputei]WOC33282.1 V-type ATPase 116kDa subunit family protein [Caproicibacterium argilliputei]
MAVIKVKVVSIIGQINELDRVTEICGRSGVFHPDHALQFYDHTEQFAQLNEENPFSSQLQRLFDSLSVIGKTPSLLSEKEIRGLSLTPQTAKAYTARFSAQMEALQEKRTQAQKEIEACTQEVQDMAHFVGINLNLDEIRECKFIKVRFGSLPKESAEALDTTYKDNPYVTFFPCTSDQRSLWGVYMCPIEEAAEIDKIFNKLYFQRLRLRTITSTPEALVKSLQEKISELKEQLQTLQKQADDLWAAEETRFTEVYSYLAERSTYFGVRHYAASYHDCFILTGWVPAENEHSFINALDTLQSVEYSLEDADNVLAHSPPVKLHNKRVVRPYEFFINMYGLPNYKEVDPTPLVAILFTLLFGIMFGDVGQGLCLAFFGYFYMWKHRKMPIGKILLPCGIMATIFGFVFGSWFGNEHFLDPLYHAFGLAGKPVSVMEGQTTIAIILISVAIGFICITISMLLNIYSSCKRKDYARALVSQNGVAALIFYVALVLGLVGQMVTGQKIVTVPYLLILIILPLAVVFLGELFTSIIHGEKFQPESWGLFFTQSFFEWFEFLLSLMSNTISFLRVGAFVLVHAGMMTMVVTLAQMVDPASGIGWYIVMAAGNIFVAVLEALLVSIHVLRLNFYEMFSRFYDGDGRAFTPIRIKGLAKA